MKEGLANGRLAARGDGAGAAAGELAEARGVGVDAIALAAVLAQPWLDVVLSGAVTRDQLDSNLAAAGVALDDVDLAFLARMAEPADEYWSARSRLPWT